MSSEAKDPAQQISTGRSENQFSWVGAWYAAPLRLPSATLSERTLRQIVRLHAGGEQIRLRLSNRYGEKPVTLSSLSVGKVVQGPMTFPGAQAVRFGGQTALTLAPGEDYISDPVALRVEAMSDLAVTFFLAEGECTTGHLFASQTSYVSGIGDVSTLPPEAALFAYPLQTTSWWLITGVDIAPTKPLNAVVAFGSSTTDGAGSTPNANRRWPDYLAQRLADAGGTRTMSVLNAGLAGNLLTSAELPMAPNLGINPISIPPFLFGEAGARRVAWDVLTQPGATDLIVNIGSNDLRVGVAGATIIAALQDVTRQARTTYRRVFGTTILSGGYTPEQREQRRIVNTWLREQGTGWFDAVFDFATPLRSPDDEAVLNPAYDSGDGIHPNDEGYRLMAAAVDLDQLTGSPSQTAL